MKIVLSYTQVTLERLRQRRWKERKKGRERKKREITNLQESPLPCLQEKLPEPLRTEAGQDPAREVLHHLREVIMRLNKVF